MTAAPSSILKPSSSIKPSLFKRNEISPTLLMTESTLMSSIYNKGPSVGNWRIQERIKTVTAGLVLCLHIGVDPPDILKTQPCSKLECWCDPTSTAITSNNETSVKALDVIGKNLVGQYEFWQPRARYKVIGDPTVEDVRKLMQSLRKSAKEERALVHWNGHGTPRPTKAGEVWVFNRQFTQYIPLAVADIIGWLGLPCTFVIDSSAAGNLFDALLSCVPQPAFNSEGKQLIALAACQSHEILPMDPNLPADLFTSCLTTPLEIAIRWHILQGGPLSFKSDLSIETIMSSIPGRLNDRKTILGELHWIFTALTDTIAWLTFPRDLFKALFRQDLLTASLFRNYLLATRIMKSYNCTPLSWPPIPSICHYHRLWNVWDHILDETLNCHQQKKKIVTNDFFNEQMNSFESWIELRKISLISESDHTDEIEPCENLPILLQVLLSQTHRARALDLIRRFFDLGPKYAIDALDVGILPYILKLLQSPCPEVRPSLLAIWSRVLCYDPSTFKDLLKDDSYMYFLKVVQTLEGSFEEQCLAMLCLSVFAHLGGSTNFKIDELLINLFERGSALLLKKDPNDDCMIGWSIFCMSSLWEGNIEAKYHLARQINRTLFEQLFVPLFSHQDQKLRAIACSAVGSFVSPDSFELPNILLELEQDLVLKLTGAILRDASELVRTELVICLSKFVSKYFNRFALAAYDLWENNSCVKDKDISLVPQAGGDIVRNPSIYSIIWEAILALSLDSTEYVSRLASGLVDEIHMSFLFLKESTVTSRETKELLFVQPNDSHENLLTNPPTMIQQPIPRPPGSSRILIASALPLPSTLISDLMRAFIGAQIEKELEEIKLKFGFERSSDEIRQSAILIRHLSECPTEGKFDRQLALLAHGSLPTKLSFHPFKDLLIVGDTRSRISVWDWEGNTKTSFFVNGNPEKSSQISGLFAISNERLLVGSTDGIVRCWKPDYEEHESQRSAKLITAHQLALVNSPSSSPIFEMDWSSFDKKCYGVGSEDKRLCCWDIETAESLFPFTLRAEACPTSIRASRFNCQNVFVGFSTGLLTEFDLRSKGGGNKTEYAAHDSWLVDVIESPISPHQIISASVLGDLCIIDKRNPSTRLMKYDLLNGQSGLLTFCGHEVIPILAVGSTDQTLRFLSLNKLTDNLNGDSDFSLHTVKYHEGLFGQRIGAPSSAAFHPNRPLYASASSDSVISIYSHDS